MKIRTCFVSNSSSSSFIISASSVEEAKEKVARCFPEKEYDKIMSTPDDRQWLFNIEDIKNADWIKDYFEEYSLKDIPDGNYIITFPSSYEWDHKTYPDSLHENLYRLTKYPRIRY